MTEGARYTFAGQSFDDLPEKLTLPLPRSYGLAPTAPEHNELVLREPTEDEITRSREHPRAKLISLVSGMPEELVRQLPVRIVNTAERYLLFFITDGLWTAPSAS